MHSLLGIICILRLFLELLKVLLALLGRGVNDLFFEA